MASWEYLIMNFILRHPDLFKGVKGDKGDPGVLAIGFSKITVGPTAPDSPGTGDLWIDTS